MKGLSRPFWNPGVTFQRSPYLYIGLIFAAGIALAAQAQDVPPVVGVIGLGSLLSLSVVTLYFQRGLWALFLALAAIGLAGMLWMLLREDLKPLHHIDRYFRSGWFAPESPVELVGYLRSDPERHFDKLILYLGLEEIRHLGESRPATGTVRLTIYSSNEAPPRFFPQGLYYGDRLRALARLRRPKDYQNLGAFNFTGYLQANDIHAIASCKSPLLIHKMGSAAGCPLMPIVMAARRWMMGRLETYLSSSDASLPSRQSAALGAALLIGERTYLSPKVEEDFKRTGAYHVLVISGLHVVALAYLFSRVLRLANIPEGAQVTLIVLVLIFYTLLTGARPSILRASVMVSVCLLGNLLYRDRGFLNAICISGVALLLINPAWLWDIGFQLTFTAVLTIALVGIPLTDLWVTPMARGLASAFSEIVSVENSAAARRMRSVRYAVECYGERLQHAFSWLSIAAMTRGLGLLGALVYFVGSLVIISAVIQCVMLLLMVNYFHRVTFIAPLINLMVVPLTTAVLFLLAFLLAVSLFSVKGAWILAWLANRLISWTVSCVAMGAEWRWAEIRVPTPPVWMIVGFLLALAAAVSIGRPWLRRPALSVFSVFLILLAANPIPAGHKPGVLKVTALDVGQGDSLFIQFPQGRTMLVDAGGLWTIADSGFSPGHRGAEIHRSFDSGEQVVAPFLWATGVRQLDYVALTHAHIDHLGGLPFILKHFQVGALLEGRNPGTDPAFAALLSAAAARQTPVRYLRRGDGFNIDGVRVEVLSPANPSTPKKVSNDDSLVMRLSYGAVSILLTGDIEERMESELAGWDCGALRADVLKIAHHGSRTSSTEPFVACVNPRLALISVGEDNPFGHPSPGVLQRLVRRDVRIYESSRHGAVVVETDGKSISSSHWPVPPHPRRLP